MEAENQTSVRTWTSAARGVKTRQSPHSHQHYLKAVDKESEKEKKPWIDWLDLKWGFPICLQCKRPGFNPWFGKMPWRREWQPPPISLPGKSHGQRSLADDSPRGCRVRHDWATKHEQGIWNGWENSGWIYNNLFKQVKFLFLLLFFS